LGGTSVANLEPVRNNATVKTIAGITKLSYFEWPITGDYAGYIQAQTLPHMGPWSRFSPSDITKLVKAPLHKPIPNVTSHTIPSTTWNFPISRVQCTTNNKLIHGKFITT
jgi:hypothetical protein